MKDERLHNKQQEMIESIGSALHELHPEMGEKFTDATILECCIPALATYLLDRSTNYTDHISGSFALVLNMPEVYEIMRPEFYRKIHENLLLEDIKTEDYARWVALSTTSLCMTEMNPNSAFVISMMAAVADSRTFG